jgi:hypothetical protein
VNTPYHGTGTGFTEGQHRDSFDFFGIFHQKGYFLSIFALSLDLDSYSTDAWFSFFYTFSA